MPVSEPRKSPAHVPELVAVKRSDPVYMAHGYLTKVPVTAIVPFIEAFTQPGDTVLDLFAGSGMTGVAAVMVGRNAELRDISALGAHIGRGYLNLVHPLDLDLAARSVAARTEATFPSAYEHECRRCGSGATLSRRTWTVIYCCPACSSSINFYECLEAASWSKAMMACPHCEVPFETRAAKRLGEQPVFDTISCACSRNLVDQAPVDARGAVDVERVDPPTQPLTPDRQMYQASALGKHGITSTTDFFSDRNLGMLTALRDAIAAENDEAIRKKLMFTFTAILPRASKRYQWSRQRPLNASNANYYIAPVFYEWNVLDLFLRKIKAIVKSDNEIRRERHARRIGGEIVANYVVASASKLDLPDESVDYVFTDPPFGSNIFYSDMNLFQETWLEQITDHALEAVVDRGRAKARTEERYEDLLTAALREARRVLVPDGWLSLNFSNSDGGLWALVQRSVSNAGFVLDPDRISVLDKGQRSVKGLASGFENVVTADLLLSMRKAAPDEIVTPSVPPEAAVDKAVSESLSAGAATPTHVYLHVVRSFLRHHWDASDLHISEIGEELRRRGLDVDPETGRLASTADALAA